MSVLTITHTHEAGTLLEGTAKGDGSNVAIKAAGGWRWSRTLGCWFVQNSRDKDAVSWKIDRAARELRAAGFEVEVQIDNTARDYAQVEADKRERLEARGEALDAKAERRAAQAVAAEEYRRAMLARVPEGGEPIKIGHHSETRHRNAIDKSWNALGKSVMADRAAEEAAERAEASKVNTELRETPRAVALRLERLRTEARQWARSVESMAARGETSERHEEGLRRVNEKIEYWEQIHAQHLEAGLAGQYSKETVSKGDWVRIKRDRWSQVVRANPKTVTVDVSAIFGCEHSLKYSWAEVTGHRTAAEVEEARRRAAEQEASA